MTSHKCFIDCACCGCTAYVDSRFLRCSLHCPLSLWYLDLEKVQHRASLGLSQHRRLRGTQSQGHAEWPYCILWEGGLHWRLKWPCVRFISRGNQCRSDCKTLKHCKIRKELCRFAFLIHNNVNTWKQCMLMEALSFICVIKYDFNIVLKWECIVHQGWYSLIQFFNYLFIYFL